MKKQVLLVVLILGLFSITNANEKHVTTNEDNSRYGYMNPFKFIERGIEFYVFPNGEFDFNTHPQHRRVHRRSATINTSYGAPSSYYHNNHGVTIKHDHLGRVRRIGNVFINYDAHNRIKRIGTVYINYRRNLIKNIGGLFVYYDRHRRVIKTTGRIKRHIGCHTSHYSNNGHGNNTPGNLHNDHMYYRKKTKR
ncbi:MAG: hypothetical protein ACPGU9_03880 [Flavobacteriaceae bacterium]